VNFYQAGTFSVEVKKEELEQLQKQLDCFLVSEGTTYQKGKEDGRKEIKWDSSRFVVAVGLRADIIETLRTCGHPCLAARVLKETFPYTICDLEQRIVDVIKELEQKYSDLGKDRDSYHEGMKDGYDHAISLLKQVKR
jgi:hypothetical protein